MFKYLLAITVLIAFAEAIPVDDKNAETKVLNSDVRPDGFEYNLEIDNGIKAGAIGDADGNVLGEFSWVDPNGVVVNVKYVADDTGYHPISDAIPTPPPTPPEILKALEYIASHPSDLSSPSGSASDNSLILIAQI